MSRSVRGGRPPIRRPPAPCRGICGLTWPAAGVVGSDLLQLVPDLAVAFGGPDPGPVDAVEFVPHAVARRTAGSVRRSASGRTAGPARCGWPRTPPAGVPPRAVDRTDLAEHGGEETAGLFDGGVHGFPAAGDPAAAADELFGAESLDPVEGSGGPVACGRRRRCRGRPALRRGRRRTGSSASGSRRRRRRRCARGRSTAGPGRPGPRRGGWSASR